MMAASSVTLMPAHRRRNYGPAHRTTRNAWAPIVATGTITCARASTGECKCNNPLILPDQPWQLDHIHGTLLPAHATCNMSAGAAYGNRLREPRTPIW